MSEDEKPFDPETFPGIMLDFNRVLCSVHGMPFKPAWPKGYAIFMVRAFQEVTAIPGVWEEARGYAGLTGDVEVPVKALERVLDFKPACCRLSRPQIVALYEESKVGALARCGVCHRKALGTPIEATNVSYKHLCFTCCAGATATPQNVM